MEINKGIRSGNERIDTYITELEEFILSWETSNIKKLITACDEITGMLAEDVGILSEINGEEDESRLKILGSKNNKIWLQLIKLIEKIEDFKGISDLMNTMKPKVIGEEATTEKVVPVKRL